MIHKHVANPDKSQPKRVRIRRLVTYVAAPDDGAKCLAFGRADGFLSEDLEGIIAEMIANSEAAQRSPDTIHHLVFSWPEDEHPTPGQAAGAVRIYLDHVGLSDHLHVWGLHADTDNRHLHLVIDRADADGRVMKINRGFTRIAGAEAVALIEAAQGWRSEPGAIVSVLEDGTLARSAQHRAESDLAPAPPQRTADVSVRTGARSGIARVQAAVGGLFTCAQSWPEIHARLAELGLVYRRRGGGAVIRPLEETVDGIAMKASSVSRHASLKRLEGRLGPFVAVEGTALGAAPHDRIEAPPGSAGGDPEGPIPAAFAAYHAALGADRYRIVSRRQDPQSGKVLTMVLDRRAGETIGFSPEELRARFAELERRDQRGEDLHVTPLSAQLHHLVVDGLTADSLTALQAQGACPAVVLACSPGRYQAVLTVPRVAPDATDERAAKRLMRELNRAFGDPRATGAMYPHRLPGAHIHRPWHRGADGLGPLVGLVSAVGGICQWAAERLRALYRGLARSAGAAPGGGDDPGSPSAGAVAAGMAAGGVSRGGRLGVPLVELYRAHRDDILRVISRAEGLSRLDATIAGRLAVTGLGEEAVAAVIAAGVKASVGGRLKLPQIAEYAVLTAAQACDPETMARTEARFAPLLPDWQRVTDRALSGAEGTPLDADPDALARVSGAAPEADDSPAPG